MILHLYKQLNKVNGLDEEAHTRANSVHWAFSWVRRLASVERLVWTGCGSSGAAQADPGAANNQNVASNVVMMPTNLDEFQGMILAQGYTPDPQYAEINWPVMRGITPDDGQWTTWTGNGSASVDCGQEHVDINYERMGNYGTWEVNHKYYSTDRGGFPKCEA